MADRVFRRMWAEFEVEVVDEMKLREFDLHTMADEEGNITGVIDMDLDERIGWAVTRVMTEALRHFESDTGVRYMGGTAAQGRAMGDDGKYAPLTLPAMPQRLPDGTYPGDPI